MTTIICARCGKSDKKTGHCQKYCASCQPIVKREQKTAAESRRRAKLGETYREYERARYAANPEPKKKSVTARYFKIKSDPVAHAARLAKCRGYCRTYNFGDEWRLVVERDGEKCILCNATAGLSIHHKDGRGSTFPPDQRNNSLDNLVLICQSCHMKIHAPYKERKNVKKKS